MSGLEGSRRTRSRSGCLNCRRRRRKCDGVRPRCRNCELRNDRCNWGLKVSFHSSRDLGLSSSDCASLLTLQGSARYGLRIVDETESVVLHAQSDMTPRSSLEFDPPCDALSDADVPCALTGSPQDHAILSRHLSDGISPPSWSPNEVGESSCESQSENFGLVEQQYPLPFSLGQAISQAASPEPEPVIPISESEKLRLVSSFLKDTGRWCETTDSEMHFTVGSVHSMMESKPFVAAAMALASRQLDAKGSQLHQATLELYQHVLQLLIRCGPADIDASVLATCTLLCVYEMMASDVSEWRRHLEGCAELLRVKKWNGSSKGIIKSCFWAFARIDVWAAFITQQKTLIPTESWVETDSITFIAYTGDLDDYCNLAILFFAQIVNLMASIHEPSGNADFEVVALIEDLWDKLQQWHSCRPGKARPLARMNRTGINPFPCVIYSQSSPICGNTFYHTGSILLLRSGFMRSPESNSENHDQVWHARELGGISTSNISHENWVNHLQPLYIAGHVFADLDGPPSQTPFWEQLTQPMSRRIEVGNGHSTSMVGDKFASEKIALLKHLAIIERETGWKTSERAARLRHLWGFE